MYAPQQRKPEMKPLQRTCSFLLNKKEKKKKFNRLCGFLLLLFFPSPMEFRAWKPCAFLLACVYMVPKRRRRKELNNKKKRMFVFIYVYNNHSTNHFGARRQMKRGTISTVAIYDRTSQTRCRWFNGLCMQTEHIIRNIFYIFFFVTFHTCI